MNDSLDTQVSKMAKFAFDLGPGMDVMALRATADMAEILPFSEKLPTRAQCEAAEAMVLAMRGLL